MKGAAGQKDGVTGMHVGIGEFDRHLQIVAGHGRVQQQRSLSVYAEVAPVQEASAADVESEFAIRDVGKVAATVGHEEGLVVLEDQLRQVRREGRCKNIVLIADGNQVSAEGLAHAVRACPARLRYRAS